MSAKAILCPHCRKIIGSEETVCSWCGTSRSNPWWRLVGMTRMSSGSDLLIKAILTVNLLLFGLSLFLSLNRDGSMGFLSPGGNSLFLLGATGTIPIDRYGRLWTLITANYLHGGILHIFFNMMALRQIAPWVVNEYGPSRMFIIYTLGGVLGYLLSYAAGIPFTVGASASICGLIGSLLYFGKSRGGVYGSSVYREVSGWIVSLFLFGLIFPGINNWGHGGGLLGGIVLGMLLGYNGQRDESDIHNVLAIFCALFTIGALGWAVYGSILNK